MSAAIVSHASACQWELRRIRKALGWEPGDGPPPDPVAVIEMIRGWEVDAQRRGELLEKHLRAVLEIARTWQPDYATKMDRDTLQYAEDFADRKTPNVAGNRLAEGKSELTGLLGGPIRSEKE